MGGMQNDERENTGGRGRKLPVDSFVGEGLDVTIFTIALDMNGLQHIKL